MSFYRKFVAALAVMGLASAVFAAGATGAAKNPSAAKVEKTAVANGTEKLNINKATAKELATIKGVTANKAKAIVSYRHKNGDFKSVDELKQVKGFKRMDETTLKEIEDHLTMT
ncbi:MAG TPA: helix-hairpin-helix domain-containing protein [Gammaproteobacteria bacterium]|nr:helix-hairpin-helix domain-containing protein [Gammaproteobacteria bacterium]